MCWQLQEVDFSFNPLTDLSGLRGLQSLKVQINLPGIYIIP